MKRLAAVAGLLCLLALGGCVYYEPVAVGPSVQQRFDRSWDAALFAMRDQGVTIEAQDRGAGAIRGTRGGVTIVASLRTRPDGSIEVRFDQPGGAAADPGLIHRVSESYERRMGR